MPKWSPDQKHELVAVVAASLLASGFNADLWTGTQVVWEVGKRFSVSYHPDRMDRILHEWGFALR